MLKSTRRARDNPVHLPTQSDHIYVLLSSFLVDLILVFAAQKQRTITSCFISVKKGKTKYTWVGCSSLKENVDGHPLPMMDRRKHGWIFWWDKILCRVVHQCRPVDTNFNSIKIALENWEPSFYRKRITQMG